MSNLFEQLCRQSPLNLPDNMREIGEGFDIAEAQSMPNPLDSINPKPKTFFGLTPPPPDRTPGFIFRYHPDGYILPSPEALARLEAIKKLDEDSCCSFDEWKALGYWVKKGAKSYFKDCLGVPQFTKEQVNPPRR